MSEADQSPESFNSAKPNPWAEVALPPLSDTFQITTLEPQHDSSELKERAVERALLKVSFDKEKLENLVLPPKFEPLRETFMRLPELEFRPGVNLIFGPNGSGKSTLLRAIYYAMKSENSYRRIVSSGDSEDYAREYADSVFKLPKGRGSDYEEYLISGAGPIFGSALRLTQFDTNGSAKYFDGQELVGRQRKGLQEMARMPGMNHSFGSYFEVSGNQYGQEDILENASHTLSARQTVDHNLYYFLDMSFCEPKWSIRDEVPPAEWTIPSEFEHAATMPQPAEDLPGLESYARKRQFYKGIITCMDEPETGMDPARHMQLPDSITSWYTSGSIMPVATNSTELYRAYLAGKFPAIDLSAPERGLHTA